MIGSGWVKVNGRVLMLLPGVPTLAVFRVTAGTLTLTPRLGESIIAGGDRSVLEGMFAAKESA